MDVKVEKLKFKGIKFVMGPVEINVDFMRLFKIQMELI